MTTFPTSVRVCDYRCVHLHLSHIGRCANGITKIKYMETKKWEVFFQIENDPKTYKTSKVYKGKGGAEKDAIKLMNRSGVSVVQMTGYDSMAHRTGDMLYKGEQAIKTNSVTIHHVA